MEMEAEWKDFEMLIALFDRTEIGFLSQDHTATPGEHNRRIRSFS
jgi:hypothetical protein